ncbi:MAG: hypothetical protein VX834_04065 [Myxococcota bacterium]|nr:hypothetical protein [Myxococcota bacterium]
MGQWRDLVTLARWLGPWASESRMPGTVRRTELIEPADCPEGEMRALVYEPMMRPVEGAFLLAPGLHFLGAPHPRFQRFASILAAAGYLVMSPFVPGYSDMQIKADSHRVFLAAFDRLCADARVPHGIKPAVFGISFGSWLVFKLLTDPERRARVAGAVVFGGYGSFHHAAQFAISGQLNGHVSASRDIRNTPAVFMHIVDALEKSEPTKSLLTEAWLRYMQETWEQDSMRDLQSCLGVAKTISIDLPEECRLLFLIGCGVQPGADKLLREALEELDFSYLDVRPSFDRILCPIYLMHGRDDDVIPYTEVDVIRSALPKALHCEIFLTGLYGHSKRDTQGVDGGGAGKLREMAMMVRMLKVFGAIGKGLQP